MGASLVLSLFSATDNVFVKMLGSPCRVSRPVAAPCLISQHEELALVIRISGSASGAFVIQFPMATAQAIARNFPVQIETREVISELGRMIVRRLRRNSSGTDISISPPRLFPKGNASEATNDFRSWVVAEFVSTPGKFVVAASITQSQTTTTKPEQAGAITNSTSASGNACYS